MGLPALELDICVSAGDLVSFPDPNSDAPIASGPFAELFHALGLTLDPTEVYTHYFFETQVGAGDVHVYSGRESDGTVLVVDYYRDRHDQVDLIGLFIRVSERNAPHVAECARIAFDSSEYQIQFQQANYSIRLQELLRPGRYPHKASNSNYQQLIHVYKDA
jgi:hypothetical protein